MGSGQSGPPRGSHEATCSHRTSYTSRDCAARPMPDVTTRAHEAICLLTGELTDLGRLSSLSSRAHTCARFLENHWPGPDRPELSPKPCRQHREQQALSPHRVLRVPSNL